MTAASTMLVSRLEAEKGKTLEFFAALSEADWNLTLYTDGEHWTVWQVMMHLTEAEDSILRLMKHVHSGGGGVPEDFDLDAYNERKVREGLADPKQDLAARFASRRDATIAWVRGLTDEDLALQGRHPFLGVAPLEDMIKLLYRHTQLHQRDIRRLVQGE